jgi:nitronate monooxygenase
MSLLDQLALPIVQAPMAGGPSTPELAAAVSGAGGLGFVAAGYRSVEASRDDIARTRSLTDAPFGVNVFVAGAEPADPELVEAYAARLRAEVGRAGVELGVPTFDDDAFPGKMNLLCEERVAVVSFTFGLPPREVVERLHAAGSEVWLTVTSPAEARSSAAQGADVLVVQGVEAGGHRALFADDDDAEELTVLAALQLVRAAVALPLVATGAIATGAAVGAVLVAGAAAAQVGTAYLRSPEAGTSATQREATATATPTSLTRAFSGRLARGIRNRFLAEHGHAAPRAYPEVHHLTAPLRAHGRTTGDADVVNLWAGQTHELAPELPAAEITRRLAADARAAVATTHARLSAGG